MPPEGFTRKKGKEPHKRGRPKKSELRRMNAGEVALENIRHERFAFYLSVGMTQADAHEKAGFRRNTGAASVLANKPHIIERVKALQEQAAAERSANNSSDGSADFDEDWACRQLNKLYQDARDAADLKEARACINDIRAIKGIGADQQQASNNNNNNGNNDKQLPPGATINLQVLLDSSEEGGDGLGVLPENLRDITPGLPELVDQTDRDERSDEPIDGPGEYEGDVGSSVHGEAEEGSS